MEIITEQDKKIIVEIVNGCVKDLRESEYAEYIDDVIFYGAYQAENDYWPGRIILQVLFKDFVKDLDAKRYTDIYGGISRLVCEGVYDDIDLFAPRYSFDIECKLSNASTYNHKKGDVSFWKKNISHI